MYKKINFENAVKRIILGETIFVRANDGSLFPIDDVEDNIIAFSKYDYYREIKIKDCPDCGSNAVIYIDENNDYVVRCSSCIFEYVINDTEEKAIKSWNIEVKNALGEQ